MVEYEHAVAVLPNLAHHAQAKAARIELSATDHLTLRVQDNGIGINNPKQRDGSGTASAITPRTRGERTAGVPCIRSPHGDVVQQR